MLQTAQRSDLIALCMRAIGASTTSRSRAVQRGGYAETVDAQVGSRKLAGWLAQERPASSAVGNP